MWVLGDLKDQLGVAHRKPRKQRKTEGNLEGAPMFQGQHSRSFSEFSNPNAGYEPAMLNSPAPSAPLRQTYLDTPPMSEAIELPPREPSVQYAQVRSSLIDPSHLSPLPTDARHNTSTSPQPSFYSASDIPPTSPLPSPKYRYPNGEVTSTPPSRRTSIATSRAVSMSGRHASQVPVPPQPVVWPPPPSPPMEAESEAYESSAYETTAFEPAYQAVAYQPTAYETDPRSGQPQPAQYALSPASLSPAPFTPPSATFGSASGHPVARAPSAASYATYGTAPEGYWTADEGSNMGHSNTGHPNAGYPAPQPDHLQQQQHQPAMLGVDPVEEDFDDLDTVTGHRRLSGVSGISTATSTWEGGRAL